MMHSFQTHPCLPSFILALLCFFLLQFFFMRVSSSAQEVSQLQGDCSPSLFVCGSAKLHISYPFWMMGRLDNCAYRKEFEISCNLVDSSFEIVIESNTYRVKEIDYENHRATIVDTEYFNNRDTSTCLRPLNTSTLNYGLFDYTEGDLKLTFLDNCSSRNEKDPYIKFLDCPSEHLRGGYAYVTLLTHVTPPSKDCQVREITILERNRERLFSNPEASWNEVLEEGFEVTWSAIDPGRRCWECVQSKGYCGYNEASPTRPTCNCNGKTYPATCPHEADSTNLNLEASFFVHAGIAHTRWATHGVPSPRNSHPQSSGVGNEFLVVHNGIITNYEVLKETLIRHGFNFESDTDTEVIPKLAKFVFDEAKTEKGEQTVTFSQVVIEVMRHLEGAYALIFKSPHYPNELIACKRGSPLLLGVKELSEDANGGTSFHDSKFPTMDGQPKELFFSSDANALIEHTRKVLVIEDDEVVHLKDGSVSILKFDYNKAKNHGGLPRPASVQRALSVLEMEVEQIKKGNYEHFMQKEIHEQPESLTTTMRGRLICGDSSKAKSVLLGGLKDHLKTIRRSRRIVFIGCGTSYNAALAARPFLEELSGVPVTMELASDLLDRQGPIYREDTAVFVSQSGETADTLLALQYALENGALCVGITNTVGSAIARNTHCGVHINAGCEIGVASTKAYTSQIAVMAMMALAIGDDTISSQARREAVIDGLFGLPNKVREVLKLDDEMKDLAKLLMDEQSLLMFGRGYNYATALEGALKVKEVALMHSEGILAGEMKHGPLALVDETLPIIVIATHDVCFSKQQSVIQQLHARKGRLIVMCSKGEGPLVCSNGSCRVIEVPQVEDCLQPVVNIVPLQLLSYHLTVLRGYNVDQPRNLAKSVTTQ